MAYKCPSVGLLLCTTISNLYLLFVKKNSVIKQMCGVTYWYIVYTSIFCIRKYWLCYGCYCLHFQIRRYEYVIIDVCFYLSIAFDYVTAINGDGGQSTVNDTSHYDFVSRSFFLVTPRLRVYHPIWLAIYAASFPAPGDVTGPLTFVHHVWLAV